VTEHKDNAKIFVTNQVVRVKDKYDETAIATRELYERTSKKIGQKVDNASEYFKSVPGRINASAQEATDFTKEVVFNAVDKVKLSFIGKKEEAPDFLQDNEYIKSGYRIDHNSCCSATKSLFTCHNESVNVWSHLMGAIMFMVFGVGLCVAIVPRRFEVGRQLLQDYSGANLI
jgi:hypothetical protein